MTQLMLPQIYRQNYQDFTALLTETGQINPREYPQIILKLQQFFREKILSLSVEELEPEVESKLQSYQTEMHKQLRLLNTDVMFLGVSQTPGTTEKRVEQVQNRIKLLTEYSQAVLNL